MEELDFDDIDIDPVLTLSPKKRAFILCMRKTFGNIAQSCDALKITRSCYYGWLKNDPVFAEIVKNEDFEETFLDFAENKLAINIQNGDVASIIFFLKTKGKKRGYVERTEIKSSLALDKAPSWFDDKGLPNTIEDAVIISETKNNENSTT